MDSASETLLIIVSTTLSVFLVLASIGLVYFIKLLRQLRNIAEHAENVAESVESAANAIEKTASPMAVLSLISNIVGKASNLKRKKG